MKIDNIFLIVGISILIFLCSITTSNELNSICLNAVIHDSKKAYATENDSGCSSIIVHVNSGHDIISYRRDSRYAAEQMIENINFAGQNAVKEYKLKNGYFTHTIITENGWIICIGGKDNPNINKQLEILGSTIISKGKVKKNDVNNANALIKRSGWGHFVIKSPDNDVGLTIYDYRVSKSMVKILKMKDGDYVKIPNNPRFYNYGQFNFFSKDPIDAAIKIAGKDIFGQNRKNIITYEYNNDNLNIWASFDGGALLDDAKGTPDNIIFMNNIIDGNTLPIIPNKKFLGELNLQNVNKTSPYPNNKEISILNPILDAFKDYDTDF